MTDQQLPTAGHADVRVIAATPEVARAVVEILRRCFATTEQRSYPAGHDGATRLHLTVDTTRAAGPARAWLAPGPTSAGQRPQQDES
ncbi:MULTISPECIES: hypothetical protein [Streptomycetaceae]|uniref:Uncharacterized protein n=1 Tax=Streptantibioticus cattleyicolor (strain ATCC 35852 / DSM 46488 / JCM 4925 / NBRC 14057 / NRRL 8057) TaxID=1003195 RepID=F8K3F7_STREN|nr:MULTISPECIES: hypothetical protein [Streptomycetaceae]AEW95076.1 hypothetical protein SCATT_27050 [Streptantibioticus cattleyicolor NRRL 8057 = DSM 46488]MYS59670.1 hypothetical protein [Streptomyces sp. SID5468]CCB75425.1 conserved protein of unknown function [Streptantibioticus cattleyicolor NRRL 8057 = DSM 46488]